MECNEPSSINEVIYITNRFLGANGFAKAWVRKKFCPKCKKSLMGKPKNPKTGKVKKRSPIYVCHECGYEEPKKEYEESLTLEVKYKCPACKHDGCFSGPNKRKKFQGVDAYVFECEECGEKIALTKKLKDPKPKKKK